MGEHTQLIGPEAAAAYLQQNPRCTLALVDRKDEKTFRDALNRTNLSIVEYGRIQGLNYSNGHHLDLGMFAPD